MTRKIFSKQQRQVSISKTSPTTRLYIYVNLGCVIFVPRHLSLPRITPDDYKHTILWWNFIAAAAAVMADAPLNFLGLPPLEIVRKHLWQRT